MKITNVCSGSSSAKDYEVDKNPLLVTPGYKIGKDGLEKHYETTLRGEPQLPECGDFSADFGFHAGFKSFRVEIDP